jgi:hypothetical protein
MRTVSYVLLCIQAAILLIPTFFGLVMGVNALTTTLAGKLQSADVLPGLMYLCMLGLLIVGWYMLSQRLFNGPYALRKVSLLWWLAAGLGALLSLIGCILLPTQSLFASFSMAVYGVPTFVHLALETWVWPPNNPLQRSGSNKRLAAGGEI